MSLINLDALLAATGTIDGVLDLWETRLFGKSN